MTAFSKAVMLMMRPRNTAVRLIWSNKSMICHSPAARDVISPPARKKAWRISCVAEEGRLLHSTERDAEKCAFFR